MHFYLDTDKEKCFVEELPAGTLVLGKYKCEQLDRQSQEWRENYALGIGISVSHNGQVIKDQRYYFCPC